MRLQASAAAAGIGGRLVGPDLVFDGASFDSRVVAPGQLFVPIVADRDGHDYIGAAYEAGAVAHLTSRADPFRRDHTAIEVADTAQALMALAQWARRSLPATAVGVTGSVGKTSTKDFIAVACGTALRTTANERSFNNEQGLPVTILDAPDDTELLVLEMGMRGFGEISTLCEIARPDIGVVTAVGESHTERVGGIEGVARAKRELVEALPARGTAVLNGDDQRVRAMADHTGADVVTYGADGDVRIVDLALDDAARATFRLESPWGAADVRLAVPGEHMAANAAAAIAVAGVMGVEPGSAAELLASAGVSPMRMQVGRAVGGALIVNDAYNANPTSMRAALDTLAAIDADRRFAVLGRMGELDDPESAHAAVAAYAADRGIEVLAVGVDLYGVAAVPDPVARLGELGSRDAVLVKASRAAGLERIAQDLMSR